MYNHTMGPDSQSDFGVYMCVTTAVYGSSLAALHNLALGTLLKFVLTAPTTSTPNLSSLNRVRCIEEIQLECMAHRGTTGATDNLV